MWALLAYDNKTVAYAITPDAPLNELEIFANGRTLIPMTPENSPAWVNGTYENGKFYPPKGMT